LKFGQKERSDIPEIDRSDVEAARMSSDTQVVEDTLLVEINKDGALLLSGEPVTEEELLNALIPAKMAERKIAIKPDARLAASELLVLSDTLRKAGLTSMTLIVNTP